jgi:hypothetical protein
METLKKVIHVNPVSKKEEQIVKLTSVRLEILHLLHSITVLGSLGC